MPKLHASTRARPAMQTLSLTSDMEFLEVWRFLMYPSLEDIVILSSIMYSFQFLTVFPSFVVEKLKKIYHSCNTFANQISLFLHKIRTSAMLFCSENI